jgi:protein SCO1
MKEDRPLTRLYATVGAIALAAVLGWTSYTVMSGRSTDAFAACRSGNVAGGAIGGPFQLVDETGQTVTDAQVITKPTLVYFGYSSCPDVCPLDNARNVEASDILAAQGADLQPIFISVDPARDTPVVLTEYTDNFGPNLLGLTGTPDQIKAAANAYKVFFQIPDHTGTEYPVDHTTMTYLVLPEIGFVDFFTRDASAQEIAERAGCFLKAS